MPTDDLARHGRGRCGPVARMLVASLLVVAAAVACTSGQDEEGSSDAAEAEEPLVATWPLTGLPVGDGPGTRPAIAVKVSNSPEARPQTGIEHADVVYEEVTEGGVTRFMAVFHSDLPPVVGPIRSARPVDTQILSGLGSPGFAYSGAREEVRALLADTPAVGITEGAPGFFRDDGTYASNPFAPHDLFLRLPDGVDAITERGARTLPMLGWRFDVRPPADGEDGSAIDIAMSGVFRSGWSYDAEAQVYRREQNGDPARVTGPDRIGADNVVVLEVRHYVGESGYPETDVVGDGAAIVLRDGRRYRARWTKPVATQPLQLLTEDGSRPFALKPGRTWIHLPERLPEDPAPAADDTGDAA